VREALDAIEEARRRNGPTDGRHQLAHIQVVHPDDVPRFGALAAVANMQPLWATHEPQMDDLTIPYLGDQRSRWQYPFAGLQRSGAHLAAGSDWPVSSPDPLAGIHVAVNRSLPPSEGEVREPFLPDQALTLQTAMTAYTAGSAYANHADDAGRLDVGALADVALLDRDIFAGEAAGIAEASVAATWVGGEPVFAR
jgi:predicted amidohydrolase YtcJ